MHNCKKIFRNNVVNSAIFHYVGARRKEEYVGQFYAILLLVTSPVRIAISLLVRVSPGTLHDVIYGDLDSII